MTGLVDKDENGMLEWTRNSLFARDWRDWQAIASSRVAPVAHFTRISQSMLNDSGRLTSWI